jgi:hypothetical protein
MRDLPARIEKGIASAMFAQVHEAGRQTGIAQQQARLLADSDAMFEAAGELIAAEAQAHLATLETDADEALTTRKPNYA